MPADGASLAAACRPGGDLASGENAGLQKEKPAANAGLNHANGDMEETPSL